MFARQLFRPGSSDANKMLLLVAMGRPHIKEARVHGLGGSYQIADVVWACKNEFVIFTSM